MATVTTTVGVGLGAGGVAAGLGVAAAGAVGLGLLGAAALASRGGNSRRGGRRNSRRHGRSLQDQTNALDNAMNLIRQEDFTGCGLRLMCELAGENEEELSEEEIAILSLAGPLVKPGEGLLPPSGAGYYAVAKSLGLNGFNCGQVYPSCPFNGTQLMDTVMAYLP